MEDNMGSRVKVMNGRSEIGTARRDNDVEKRQAIKEGRKEGRKQASKQAASKQASKPSE
jgi:hypothetical protein